jgi:hypothetical protein
MCPTRIYCIAHGTSHTRPRYYVLIHRSNGRANKSTLSMYLDVATGSVQPVEVSAPGSGLCYHVELPSCLVLFQRIVHTYFSSTCAWSRPLLCEVSGTAHTVGQYLCWNVARIGENVLCCELLRCVFSRRRVRSSRKVAFAFVCMR